MLTKTSLMRQIADEYSQKYPGLTKSAIKNISGAIIDKIAKALQNGEDVRITGFATFRIKKHKGDPIRYYDFTKGRVVETKAPRNIVQVKVSKKAR